MDNNKVEVIPLTNDQIIEVTESWMELLNAEEILDKILNYIEGLEEKEREIFNKAPLLTKILICAIEMYKRGLILGVYAMNEALKTPLEVEGYEQ